MKNENPEKNGQDRIERDSKRTCNVTLQRIGVTNFTM
jgi:hypothetical protein